MDAADFTASALLAGHRGFIARLDEGNSRSAVYPTCACGWRGRGFVGGDELRRAPLWAFELLHREWELHVAQLVARQPTVFNVEIDDDGRWRFTCRRCGWKHAARVSSEGDRMVMVVAVETHRDDHEDLELTAGELIAEHTGDQGWTDTPRVGRPGGGGPTRTESAPRRGEAPGRPGRAATSTT